MKTLIEFINESSNKSLNDTVISFANDYFKIGSDGKPNKAYEQDFKDCIIGAGDSFSQLYNFIQSYCKENSLNFVKTYDKACEYLMAFARRNRFK